VKPEAWTVAEVLIISARGGASLSHDGDRGVQQLPLGQPKGPAQLGRQTTDCAELSDHIMGAQSASVEAGPKLGPNNRPIFDKRIFPSLR